MNDRTRIDGRAGENQQRRNARAEERRRCSHVLFARKSLANESAPPGLKRNLQTAVTFLSGRARRSPPKATLRARSIVAQLLPTATATGPSPARAPEDHPSGNRIRGEGNR